MLILPENRLRNTSEKAEISGFFRDLSGFGGDPESMIGRQTKP
jgi:hypothetical protein